MKKSYFNWVFTLVLSLLITLPALSQNKKALWNKTTKTIASSKKALALRKTEPIKADYYQLDINALKTELQAAPNRNTFSGTSNVILDFPTAEGTFEAYRIKEAPIMEEALQNKYPNIRTYLGESVSTPGNIIRFSVTPQGLHTMSMSNNKGSQFIDPYTTTGNEYIVYAKKDLPLLDQNWECGVIDGEAILENKDLNINMQRNAFDGLMRNFRLAVATTIEYSSFHWMAAGLTNANTVADRKAAVMAAIVVTINRNNQIYERELSITMTLVANNDAVVFINSDNFSNDNANALINESQTVINGAIGNANYDIGHTFSTGGGGLAQLNSPCITGSKARGITGLPTPVGDAYDVDFVAHELGHQFGAPHTFNGDAGNCAGGNRTASNAFEPGSGSTIMAYAGICAPQNVQGNSDAYFHQKSLQMIWDNVFSGNSQCATTTSTGNNAPTSNAGLDYTIPRSTPYKLTGSSSDGAEGTATHTYTWEQYDLGPAGLPLETNTSGPMVRSFQGTSNPVRYIPRLADVVNTGGTSTTWEKLPSVARTQAFRLTVRDNDAAGGQTAVDEMITNVVSSAGPFIVTSQNTTDITWLTGETRTITWDVAGTTANGVNTANVNILLSTDGGLTFDTVLATNVPNNGTHDITVPNVFGGFCRVMVEGAGNIFYNINSEDFKVNASVTTTCTTYSSANNLGLAIPDGPAANTQGTPVFNNLNIPDAGNVDEIKVTVDVTHSYIGDLIIQIQDPNDAQFANVWARSCNDAQYGNISVTFDDTASPFVCASPTTGTYAPAAPLNVFNGVDQQGDWQIALVDFYNGDTGTLNSWSIDLCSTTIINLSVDEFGLTNSFSVFPNPNNGEFTVKFNGATGNVNLQVVDIRGRSILNNSYTTSGDFNQTINLGNVQSGMYLLNVSDGGRTIKKKIVVE